MIDLIGVPHGEWYLNVIIEILTNGHPKGIDSLLVELPKNWPDFVASGINDGFFHPLAHAFEQSGTRIFYGDRARRVPKTSLGRKLYNFEGFYDAFLTNRRNQSLEISINENQPEVVVVGRKHADYLRDRISHVHYTAIERDWRNYPRFPCESLIHKIQGEPNNPDTIFILHG